MAALPQESEIYPGSRLTMMEVFRNIMLTEFNRLGDDYLASLRDFFNHRNTQISVYSIPENQRNELRRLTNEFCGNVINIYKNELIRLVEREFRFELIQQCHQISYLKWHLNFYTLSAYERIRDELDHQGYLVPRKLIGQVELQKRRTNDLFNRLNQQTRGGAWTLSLFNKKCTLYLAIREAVKNYPQSDIYRCLYGDAPPPPPVPPQVPMQVQQPQQNPIATQQVNTANNNYHQLQVVHNPASAEAHSSRHFPTLPPPPASTPMQAPPPLTYHPFSPIHSRF
jgi:hypothetical protein